MHDSDVVEELPFCSLLVPCSPVHTVLLLAVNLPWPTKQGYSSYFQYHPGHTGSTFLPTSSTFICLHRTIWVGRDPKSSSSPTSPQWTGYLQLDQAAQSPVQPDLEHPQGWDIHISGQHVPGNFSLLPFSWSHTTVLCCTQQSWEQGCYCMPRIVIPVVFQIAKSVPPTEQWDIWEVLWDLQATEPT